MAMFSQQATQRAFFVLNLVLRFDPNASVQHGHAVL